MIEDNKPIQVGRTEVMGLPAKEGDDKWWARGRDGQPLITPQPPFGGYADWGKEHAQFYDQHISQIHTASGDHDGDVRVGKTPSGIVKKSNESQSIKNYRNVMNNLIARAIK